MASVPPNLRSYLGQLGLGGNRAGQLNNHHLPDTSEKVCISALSLVKMLKHGRAGVPMEVMGLMLGEFIDDFTIRVVDVFSMPQSGNTVSVEAVDPAYQSEMMEMLKATGRPQTVVGWYHSHPGFGCWFSGTDINTQQSFEQLHRRAVGVVVDPIQSVKGKVVIDCFRLIDTQTIMLGNEARQITSNVGRMKKHTISALVHGLNRHYYSLVIDYKKTAMEHEMLLNFNTASWMESLEVKKFSIFQKDLDATFASLKDLTKKYVTDVEEEFKATPEELIVARVRDVGACLLFAFLELRLGKSM